MSGRAFTLRVSVLDRCQYRCPYCRPGSMGPPIARAEQLSAADYARLAPVFHELGVDKVRFTGGEPLLRPDMADVVSAFRSGMPGCRLALTTNGQLLARNLDALATAGLTGATVHVDSLRPDRYRALMGDGDVGAILEALDGAQKVLSEVKINTVVQRGKNDDELCDLLALSASTGIEVRFIELMNTGSAIDYCREAFFSGREIVGAVRARLGATPIERRRPSDPAALWRTDRGVVFGVIASDTEPFCAECNRLRLTANGDLRGCLYQATGTDLLPADDAALRARIFGAAADKTSFHPAALVKLRLPFSMAQTGG